MKSSNFYQIDGVKYDRVTRITGCLPKQNILINWAAKITAEAAADVDQREYQTKGIFADAVKAESKRRRIANRDRGTESHGAIEAHYNDDEVVELYMPWVNQAEEIMDAYKLTQADHEITLVNVDLQYAGTADLLTKGMVLDWKTGSRIYADYLIQIWAYMEATHWVDEEGSLQEMGTKPDIGVIAHLEQHRHETLELHRNTQLFEFCGQTFQHLQGVKRWLDSESEIL